MENTEPNEPILDGWSGIGLFRPHIGPIFWLPCSLVTNEVRRNILLYYALKTVEEYNLGAVIYDEQLQCLGEELRIAISQKYEPGPVYEDIWMPK